MMLLRFLGIRRFTSAGSLLAGAKRRCPSPGSIAMHKGADPWQAAGYLGMSLEVLLNTHGHHHPDYLSDAVEKIAKRDHLANEKRTYLVRLSRYGETNPDKLLISLVGPAGLEPATRPL